MTGAQRLGPPVLRDLVDAVGPDQVRTDAADRASFETDWTGRFAGSTPAVVLPGSSAEVAAVVEAVRRHGVALVPQGGNTGLVGGGVPLDGEVVLSLRRLTTVGSPDLKARQITAGAGATLAAVQAAAAGAGLRYAVDFAARYSATVGGTVATNAGGPGVFRHGGTREQLVGLDAVLGTGARTCHLSGLVKDNSGYHLPSLLCGSEGTLGVVTAARLRLVTRHPNRVTALVGFESVAAAVEAVAAWRGAIDELEAAELMLASGMHLVSEVSGLAHPMAGDWPAYALIETSAHHDPSPLLARAVADTAGAGEVAVATDRARRRALWRHREMHPTAIATLGTPHKLDVTVPIGSVAHFVEAVDRRAHETAPECRVWQFGHVADGNIHVNVTGLALDDERVDDAVLRLVADLDGSISAEHGIGTAKARWLSLTRTAGEIAAMRAVKAAFDPDHILNPGAVLPRTT